MPGVTLSPSGKVNHYGIEVVNRLTWQGWEPGKEYTKNIVLKNIRVKTQKLKYKTPTSRFFNTLYPQPIVLSAGTSFTLPVTFRPLEKTVYSDVLEFTTNEGAFTIPIEAVLPEFNIEVPNHIHFNMCAAADSVQLTFDIKNCSELRTAFAVECQEPFTVEPSEGVLAPYGTATLTTTFKPTQAAVYEATCVVKYGNDLSFAKSTKFEGIGKYPHLLVSTGGRPVSPGNDGPLETVLCFGEVPINHTVEKWIELKNQSPVNAPFHIEQLPGGNKIDTVFQCPQRQGVVAPLSTLRLPITFCPNILDCKSIDYFHVITIGNISKTVVKCTGSSIGPRVVLSEHKLNFSQIDLGYSVNKTLEILNESDVEASYQFQLDCNESAFKFDHVSGTLAPRSRKTVVIKFIPDHAINYYRRLAVLVHNQDVLYLDLLGTCHSETSKPAVLQYKHIERYRLHVDRGLSFTPPELLNEMVQEGELIMDAHNGSLCKPQEENQETEGSISRGLLPMDEYFHEGSSTETKMQLPHVSMDINSADFGQCPDLRLIHKQTVNLTNHTNGKITVVWMGGPDHTFSVSPSVVDIPPQKSSPFTVTFRPLAPNQFYGSELECYAFYKSMRDYRLTEDKSHFPPWCLTLSATGQTFQPHSETFLPRFVLDSHKVTFPAVNADESTYRTILLTNTGTTPIAYNFEKDAKGIFSVKPENGLLSTNSHQVFVVQILPKEVHKIYRHTLQLRLNDADKNTQEILALGSAEVADVLLESEGELYFKPTCVGTSSKRQYYVKNTSRIPLEFEWRMTNHDAKLLTVIPNSGVIQPGEKQFHTWSFVPNEQNKFVMKPTLIVNGVKLSAKSSGGKKRPFVLRAIGEGSTGQMQPYQAYVDFGTIVVGSSASSQIIFTNDGNCSLHYKLFIDQSISGPYAEEITRDDLCALKLSQMEGVVPARSKQVINGVVRPHRRVYYQFAISYELLTPELKGPPRPQDTRYHLCHVLAAGVFPTLAITDARSFGSAITISKKQLWNLFSLDNLNVCLDSDPSAAEIVYTATTRHSHNRRPPVYTRAILDFNFSAAPVKSEPCHIQLMLENTGSVPCDWAFLFPKDLQLELEYWAETGEFDADELHEMKVMDNKLFDVEPRKGKLHPGENVTVTFTYRHLMAGTDRLPVLFKLASGREILLNFIGVTVEPGRRYIHFPSNKFMFSPVAVAEKSTPTQVYELYNGGAVPVRYQIDTTPLDLLKSESYDHPIFEVLNPVGEIEPGYTAAVEWKFSPLEAKTYMVDVPIRIHNGDTAIVTFAGVGYDKRVMGETMQLAADQLEANGVPSIQSVSVPGQLVYLSEERVAFYNIPLYSRARRMFVMTNRSTEHGTHFEWHVTAQKDSKYVNVWPHQGDLQPGESCVCKVTFTAIGAPSFYDIDLVCEVTNMTNYNKYRADLVAWEKERERQRTEFKITENDPHADTRVGEDPESRPPSGRLKAITGARTPSPDGDIAKYKTLPPIKTTTIDQDLNVEEQKRRVDAEFWERPSPARPFIVHLGVTARTHDIVDFQTNFPEEYANFYIDRSLSAKETEDRESKEAEQDEQKESSAPEAVPCVELEADVIAGALSSVIRGLLDDTTFHDQMIQLQDEPTPYFSQYSTKPRASTSPATPAPSIVIMAPPESPDGTGSGKRSPSEGSPVPGYTSPKASQTPAPESSARSTHGSLKGSRQGSAASSSPKALSMGDSMQVPGAPHLGEAVAKTTALKTIEETQRHTQKQTIKKRPEFGNMVESVLENALTNVISEAFVQEFNITAPLRLVALPPRPSSAKQKE